ncbi:hypothetical protein V0R50_21115 [Pseudomonas sp. 148P]|uniref:Integrase n=2 Tax=Pseudomonas ulcerans TaxID=3115852 RepID=A0ABU7HVZ5_9PSED|nr:MULTISPECIES: hypothetical protein [unclassified Pseudomonas]MEE1922889.1 hypothetical protein [Pseudomonas sp. 147P]MEE1935739.1 hypothetical protein [Pseudomonas sp. 148P]
MAQLLDQAERLSLVSDLMRHWGEQCARQGLGSSMGSQMGTIMEWKGAAPRGGSSGSRILIAGAGLDHSAAEVDAAVAELDRRDKRGAALAKLARLRYLHGAPVREQMREVGLAEGADRTYRNWVKALHLQVFGILSARAGRVRQSTVRRVEMRLVCNIDAT